MGREQRIKKVGGVLIGAGAAKVQKQVAKATDIEVPASPLGAIFGSLARHAITLAGGGLVAKGYMDNALLTEAAGAIVAAAPTAWGVLRAWIVHSRFWGMAMNQAVPARVIRPRSG